MSIFETFGHGYAICLHMISITGVMCKLQI